jgi:predicted AlkP superfamily pyrophosphatase or phosphodiesterase
MNSATTPQGRSGWPRVRIGVLLLAAAAAALATSMVWAQQLVFAPAASTPLSNGTHPWRRSVILVSLDGVRPAYLTPELLPHLSQAPALVAESMRPVSPSLTFPNHWSLLTGVSPGRHGIVANDFHRILRDNSSEAFFYQDPARSWNGSWWGAEPLWSVAERAGQSSAVLAWPGPPITSHGERPRHFQRYVKGWSTADRLRTIERWLDMGSVDERPSLICGELHGISSPLHDADAQSVAYVPDVDAAAHGAGPDPSDPSVAAALRAVDDFIAALLRSIAARNASELVDVVVVSDHGMTQTSSKRLIYLDEALGAELYGEILTRDGWPSAGLRFKSASAQTAARDRLRKLAKASSFQLLDAEPLAQQWNWTAPDEHVMRERVAPLWMVPDVGWSITTAAEMATFSDGVYSPRG